MVTGQSWTTTRGFYRQMRHRRHCRASANPSKAKSHPSEAAPDNTKAASDNPDFGRRRSTEKPNVKARSMRSEPVTSVEVRRLTRAQAGPGAKPDFILWKTSRLWGCPKRHMLPRRAAPNQDRSLLQV